MAIKVQFNPSTGKVLYNPSTGKVLTIAPAAYDLRLSLSEFVDCGCTERTCLGESWGADWEGGMAAALNGFEIEMLFTQTRTIGQTFGKAIEYRDSNDGSCAGEGEDFPCHPLYIRTNTIGNQTTVHISTLNNPGTNDVFLATITHGSSGSNTYAGCSYYNPAYGEPGEPCLLEHPCGSSGSVAIEVL